MARSGLARSVGPRVAAKAVLAPFSGWFLGAGEKAGIAARLRLGVWRSLHEPFEVQWLEGLKLRLYPGNETSQAIFITGRYEPNEFCLLAKILKPGMTFLDVGANMGLYSLFAARKVGNDGRVLAFEPSSREWKIAKNNVEVNGLSNVNLLHLALCDQAAEINLLVAPLRNSGHNTLGAFAYGTSLECRERVPADRLDDVLRREALTRVDVIKVDIEGAELRALRGAVETLERFRPILFVEISERALRNQGCTSGDLLAFIAQQGYDLYNFDRQAGMPTRLAPRSSFDSENIVAAPVGVLPW
jgi:FkbM family methyltransferase